MLLRVVGVSKRFGGVQALKDVSFELEAGEIHALVGANGAGKSTLSKVIMGHIQPDTAQIELMGRPVRFHTPKDAITHGIAMVTQQLSLALDLTVAENIMLPELGRPGRYRTGAVTQRAAHFLHTIADRGTISLHAPVGDLSTSHRQIVEIAKALALEAKIIFFDEPTASLTPYEVDRLFDIMTGLAEAQKGLVFVSHRMEEIYTISDRITVLRDGANAGPPARTEDLTQPELVRRMIGRDLGADVYRRQERQAVAPNAAGAGGGKPILEVMDLAVFPAVKGISFQLRPGEILGLAGLVGSGRTTVARSLFGLETIQGGEIKLDGAPYYPRNPGQALERGVVLIPEDRQKQGLIPDFSVRENARLSLMARQRSPLVSRSREQDALMALFDALSLPRSYLETNVLALSGGMQQKVVLMRGLLMEPRVLVVDEPTQGVDIGTRSEIYGLLRKLAGEGLAVLFISSDFEEVLGASDRVAVMAEGRLAADIESQWLDEEKLTMFAAPRSSASTTHRILTDLNQRYGASAFWVYVDDDRVYCFNKVDEGCAVETGFGAGKVCSLDQTRIPKALQETRPVWIDEQGVRSLLIPITSQRGQSMGCLGISAACDQSGLPGPEELTDWVLLHIRKERESN